MTYQELRDKNQKEFNEFPCFFAFSNDQFYKGMEKMGLDPKDTDKVYKGVGGMIYKREDSKALKEMMERHEQSLKDAIEADKTGEGFIYDMFNYELGNHEFAYTCDYEDTLLALGMTLEEIEANEALNHGFKTAQANQLEGAM